MLETKDISRKLFGPVAFRGVSPAPFYFRWDSLTTPMLIPVFSYEFQTESHQESRYEGISVSPVERSVEFEPVASGKTR